MKAEISEGKDNIRRVYDLADAIDLREGILAYERYHATMQELAAQYGYPLARVAAVFVSLSPNNDYLKNLRSTAAVLRGHKEGVPVSQISVSTYNHCKHRAYAFAAGLADFLDVTQGKKIRAFYQNILDPKDPAPVTIDGHMLGVWLGRQITMKEAARIKWRYETIAEDFRAVAGDVGVRPNQVQAVAWFCWKRVNHVVYKPQLGLFCGAENQWRNYMPADEIKPYPVRPLA